VPLKNTRNLKTNDPSLVSHVCLKKSFSSVPSYNDPPVANNNECATVLSAEGNNTYLVEALKVEALKDEFVGFKFLFDGGILEKG
jgi:hypothetical protein